MTFDARFIQPTPIANFTMRPCEIEEQYYDTTNQQMFEWEEGNCYYCNRKSCVFRTENAGEDVFFADKGDDDMEVTLESMIDVWVNALILEEIEAGILRGETIDEEWIDKMIEECMQ